MQGNLVTRAEQEKVNFRFGVGTLQLSERRTDLKETHWPAASLPAKGEKQLGAVRPPIDDSD
jgi:hypothetical protein